MKLALFDFDGTISNKDSFSDFIQYAVGKPVFYWSLLLLSPVILQYKLKLVSNHSAKKKLIKYFFGGWTSIQFNTIADCYAHNEIDKIIRPTAMARIKWHQQNGHKVVIVSATIECWLKKWCQKHNIDLIATRLEIQNGKLTGEFATRNCYGIEKVNRIRARYDLAEYSIIYAYGDSPGDSEMLNIADQPYYKYFA